MFSGISAGLGFVLLRQGWNLRQPNQVEVNGSSLVNRDQVIQAAGLHFPQPLLELQPKQLGDQLMATLPVAKVRLGPNDRRLPRRLEVVAQLNRVLPAKLGGRRPQLIDLSDPEQPELSVAAGKAGGSGGASLTAPRGGQ